VKVSVKTIRAPLLVMACAAGALACSAQAADFRSVQESAAVLYDAPSRQAKPLFVVSRSYPLEVIVNLEAWVKVRDHAGALTWIEKKSLSDKRTVLVTAPSVEVRQKAEDGAPAAFSAAQNVALELVEIAPNGWLRVRHADGAVGFVRADSVWGD
jgi:SH3-like domain-containing protein